MAAKPAAGKKKVDHYHTYQQFELVGEFPLLGHTKVLWQCPECKKVVISNSFDAELPVVRGGEGVGDEADG